MKDLQWLRNNYRELTTEEFYRYIFPIGSFEKCNSQSDSKPNGVMIHGHKKDGLKRELIFDDLKGIIKNAKGDEDCFMPLAGYIGRSYKRKNARKLYALGFDIDYLDLHEKGDAQNYFCPIDKYITWLFEMNSAYKTAMPNLVVRSSENHYHFYYIFEEPMNCYNENLEQLKKIKNDMTDNFWRSDFTDIKKHPIEFESVLQPFRVVGSKNNKHGNRIHGFMMNEKKYKNINDLITIINTTNRFKKKFPYPLIEEKKRDGSTSLKKQSGYHWTCKKDLYNWYLNYLQITPKQGSRYWRCFVLSSIAFKCAVPKKELKNDLKNLTEILNKGDANATEPFTWEDAVASMKGYAKEYVNVGIDFVNLKCQTPRIERAKRRFRKQSIHLKLARSNLEILNIENGTPLQGRKIKKDIVIEWRKEHPNGSKKQCVRDSHLSKTTVKKWWDAKSDDATQSTNNFIKEK